MEVLLILFLLGLVIMVLIILYALVKWIFQTKARAIVISLFILIVVAGWGIYQLFFVKLEFIQSKVYPDLYLVDNFHEDKRLLNQAIKDFAIQHIKTKIKENQIYTSPTMRFYAYYKSYNPLVFGDSGTAYFIENEEDLSGMIVEDLSMYIKLKLAVLEKTSCENDSYYCAKLHFYEQGNIVKSEAINIKQSF